MAGGDASQMPAALDPNWINRKFEAIEQWQREMMPSVAQSVTGIVTEITARFPIASVIPCVTLTAPTGWWMANGGLHNIVDGPDLFAHFASEFGAGNYFGGDGITTFGVPLVNGRTVVGYDPSQAEFNTVGETGGAKTHTLSAGEMPGHTHTFSGSDTASHSHGMGMLASSTPGSGAVSMTAAGSYTWNTNSASVTISIAGTTSSAGGNGAHNNLQPYIALPYIIKHHKL